MMNARQNRQLMMGILHKSQKGYKEPSPGCRYVLLLHVIYCLSRIFQLTRYNHGSWQPYRCDLLRVYGNGAQLRLEVFPEYNGDVNLSFHGCPAEKSPLRRRIGVFPESNEEANLSFHVRPAEKPPLRRRMGPSKPYVIEWKEPYSTCPLAEKLVAILCMEGDDAPTLRYGRSGVLFSWLSSDSENSLGTGEYVCMGSGGYGRASAYVVIHQNMIELLSDKDHIYSRSLPIHTCMMYYSPCLDSGQEGVFSWRYLYCYKRMVVAAPISSLVIWRHQRHLVMMSDNTVCNNLSCRFYSGSGRGIYILLSDCRLPVDIEFAYDHSAVTAYSRSLPISSLVIWRHQRHLVMMSDNTVCNNLSCRFYSGSGRGIYILLSDCRLPVDIEFAYDHSAVTAYSRSLPISSLVIWRHQRHLVMMSDNTVCNNLSCRFYSGSGRGIYILLSDCRLLVDIEFAYDLPMILNSAVTAYSRSLPISSLVIWRHQRHLVMMSDNTVCNNLSCRFYSGSGRGIYILLSDCRLLVDIEFAYDLPMILNSAVTAYSRSLPISSLVIWRHQRHLVMMSDNTVCNNLSCRFYSGSGRGIYILLSDCRLSVDIEFAYDHSAVTAYIHVMSDTLCNNLLCRFYSGSGRGIHTLLNDCRLSLNFEFSYDRRAVVTVYVHVMPDTLSVVGVARGRGIVLFLHCGRCCISGTAVQYILQIMMRHEFGGSTRNEALLWAHRGSPACGTPRPEEVTPPTPVYVLYSAHLVRHDWSTWCSAICWNVECVKASVVPSGRGPVDVTFSDYEQYIINDSFQVLLYDRSRYTYLIYLCDGDLACRALAIVQVRQVISNNVIMGASTNDVVLIPARCRVEILYVILLMACLYNRNNHYYVCESKSILYITDQCNCLFVNEVNG